MKKNVINFVMFKLCQDEDFDFSEDFLQDAFDLDKNKNAVTQQKTTQAAIDNSHITKSTFGAKPAVSDPIKNCSDIESLLDDNWDIDVECLSEINNIEKAVAYNNDGLRAASDVISSGCCITKGSVAVENGRACDLSQLLGHRGGSSNRIEAVTKTSSTSISTPCDSVSSIQNASRLSVSCSLNNDLKGHEVNPNSLSNGAPGRSYCAVDNRRNSPVYARSPMGLRTECPKSMGRTKRKFPGPAGILPELQPGGKIPKTLSPAVNFQRSPKFNESCIQEPMSSQCSQFESDTWQRMKRDFDIDDSDPNSLLARFNISWILLKAGARELPTRKAPVLVAVLKTISMEWNLARVVLQDQTGEMLGTIHDKVLEEHGPSLQPGTVLVLRKISIFSPTPSRHYANITPSNIVAIYAQGDAVNVQNLEGSHHLEASINEYLSESANSSNQRTTNVSAVPRSLWNNTLSSPCAPNAKSVELDDDLWGDDDVDAILRCMDDKDLCG